LDFFFCTIFIKKILYSEKRLEGLLDFFRHAFRYWCENMNYRIVLIDIDCEWQGAVGIVINPISFEMIFLDIRRESGEGGF